MAEPLLIFNDDPAAAVAELVAEYEAIAGRTLGNADPERLIVSAMAQRLAQHKGQCNVAVNQNFVRFATGAALEEIAYKFGIFRLDPSSALVTLRFTISGATGSIAIPEGTRVKSTDGKVMFATIEEVTSPDGFVDVVGKCVTAGAVGNGYIINTITNITDPIPTIATVTVTNIETSKGGSDEESDDQLRERIPKANATFSVAGPSDAYIFYAKSASADIVDVGIIAGDPPGTVKLYPLLSGGEVPSLGVRDAVLAICSDKKVRPLNDIVTVHEPTVVNYSMVVALQVKRNAASAAAAQAAAEANLEAYAEAKQSKCGGDVVIDQIKAACMAVTGAYSANVTVPVTDLTVENNEFAKCGAITVSVTVVDEE